MRRRYLTNIPLVYLAEDLGNYEAAKVAIVHYQAGWEKSMKTVTKKITQFIENFKNALLLDSQGGFAGTMRLLLERSVGRSLSSGCISSPCRVFHLIWNLRKIRKVMIG